MPQLRVILHLLKLLFYLILLMSIVFLIYLLSPLLTSRFVVHSIVASGRFRLCAAWTFRCWWSPPEFLVLVGPSSAK